MTGCVLVPGSFWSSRSSRCTWRPTSARAPRHPPATLVDGPRGPPYCQRGSSAPTCSRFRSRRLRPLCAGCARCTEKRGRSENRFPLSQAALGNDNKWSCLWANRYSLSPLELSSYSYYSILISRNSATCLGFSFWLVSFQSGKFMRILVVKQSPSTILEKIFIGRKQMLSGISRSLNDD